MTKKSKISLVALTAIAVIGASTTITLMTTNNHIDHGSAEECAHDHVEYYEAGSATADKPGYRSHYACCKCHLAWADENKTKVLGRTADYGTELADRSKIDCYDIDWDKTFKSIASDTYVRQNTKTLHFVRGEYDASKNVGETTNDKVSYSFDDTSNKTLIVTSPCLIRFKDNDASTGIFHDFKALTDFDIGNIETSSLTKMSEMFMGTFKISEIKNITVMDTSSATTMFRMFQGSNAETCYITELDLSKFDTSNVTDFGQMFYCQKSLKTIYVSDSFVTTKATQHTYMFFVASALVGGKGTAYDKEHTDKEYARIDQGPGSSAPGYFTDIKDKPAEVSLL